MVTVGEIGVTIVLLAIARQDWYFAIVAIETIAAEALVAVDFVNARAVVLARV